MYRPTSFAVLPLVLAGLLAAGCDEATPVTGPTETPVSVTETFTGTVTVNGAVTHPFSVARAGEITARLVSLSVADATIGLSLGTWNGQVCQIILANDNASMTASSVTGTASAGAFCVRLYDVSKLTGAVDYEVAVTHF